MNFIKQNKWASMFILVLVILNCSSDDSSDGNNASTPSMALTGQFVAFGDVNVLSHSASQSVAVSGGNLTNALTVQASENFEVSLDDVVFSSSVTINVSDANSGSTVVYARFSPAETAVGVNSGTVSFQSTGATTKTLNVSGIGVSITPVITVNRNSMDFEDTEVSQASEATTLNVNGDNLVNAITMVVTDEFEISLDDVNYGNSLQIDASQANNSTLVYVRFAPTSVGNVTGTLTLQNPLTDDVVVNLTGNGLALIHNYVTFENERLAFGGGFDQSSTRTFSLHNDLTNIETIKMYVKLRCPTGGCDEWDVYANVKVRDTDSGELYELGRYITPYWNDNSQLERGFEFDVTDFKSLLAGSTELRIRTECWNDRGYEVTVDFDYIEGAPDYPYYAVSRVIAYDEWSTSGVPYGVTHSLDLVKSVAIPSNSESTHLRTIISGWGHATPNDAGGRGCAEWCYRTHDVKINSAAMFQHDLGPIGCASNPVSNQSPGNWQPDRAGWCPGMVVPVRTDQFASSMAASTFSFEYDYEDWTSNGGNGNAYYATSTFVVVKSTTPITKPVVMD